MHQICSETGVRFEVTNNDLAYLDAISPVFAGKKCLIPPPKLSPEMRFRRRLAFRAERYLFSRCCDLTGKNILSVFSPELPYLVYDQDAWWGDNWDALSYGRDFDFSRPFADQYQELLRSVPHMSLYTRNVENSYYTNYTVNLKNCYLSFGTIDSENCLYCRQVWFSRDVLDSFFLLRCELCYEGLSGERCYNTAFFANCRDCQDCLFTEDCQSCSNCALCFGLYKKQYCVLNEQLDKKRYEEFLSSLYPLTQARITELRSRLTSLRLKLPHRQSQIFHSEDCTGDTLFNCKNCIWCFDCSNCEDACYLYSVSNGHGCRDGSFAGPGGPDFSYEFCSSAGSTNSMGIFLCWYCDNARYSMECQSCRDVFGCCGLKKKQYCVFNKQYSKDEYEKLVLKIVMHMQQTGEWGEYLPVRLSPFGYNHTVAQEHFPLSKDEILAKGFHWVERVEKVEGEKLATPIPENIELVDDSVTKAVLHCERSNRPYKITPQELRFYRKLGLPLPLICPEERHLLRLSRRAPRSLYLRNCAKTGRPIWTTFAPDRPEIVYSEDAYRAEVY